MFTISAPKGQDSKAKHKLFINSLSNSMSCALKIVMINVDTTFKT